MNIFITFKQRNNIHVTTLSLDKEMFIRMSVPK